MKNLHKSKQTVKSPLPRLSPFSREFLLEKNVALAKPTVRYVVLFIAISFSGFAQTDTWVQKADFGGTARDYATGFSIGTKGYMGTGYDGSSSTKDFWEYDSEVNTWTQKADFGGGNREGATGFSIGSKGYIGTGLDGSNGSIIYKDEFWEYDPDNNSWTQKADFAGGVRIGAVGFSIGNKGYLGTGYHNNNYLKDFWEYDPVNNSWTPKAFFGGIKRSEATGFSIGNKGYIGTGTNYNNGPFYKDFWEYDPSTNSWMQKADFGGEARGTATGFSLGSKGYIGIGCCWYNDFWEYDPVSNTWTKKADFGGGTQGGSTGFSIGNKGYIGTGFAQEGSFKKDFWEYTPEADITPCTLPTLLSTVNITSTKATLKWDIVSAAIGYKIRYKIAGSDDYQIVQSTDNDIPLHGLSPNTGYAWQVKSVCGLNPLEASEWSEKQFFTTADLRLAESMIGETSLEVDPNPVSQSATVSFFLYEGSPVVIQLMDVNGRSLRVIANENFSDGNHEVIFHRESLSAGIYFLQMKTNDGVIMKKITVLH